MPLDFNCAFAEVVQPLRQRSSRITVHSSLKCTVRNLSSPKESVPKAHSSRWEGTSAGGARAGGCRAGRDASVGDASVERADKVDLASVMVRPCEGILRTSCLRRK